MAAFLWPKWTRWLIWITTFTLAMVTIAPVTASSFSLTDIHFTQGVYNATIPENSLGKTFVTPSSKMGIYIHEGYPVKITYHIQDTQDDLFKAEDYLLGDFSFLLVRTHSNSYGRLNREFKSKYNLNIKAVVENQHGATFETTTKVIVYVSDLNDLQPLFDYKLYNVSVREDAPLHASIAHVSAFDGDEGINSEIYYSFVQRTNVFSIHPTSGVVTLTRPLNYFLKKKYTIEILAHDRGPSLRHSSKRPANLTVNVVQVNYFAPEILITKLPVVIEQEDESIVLAMVNVADRDIGENGLVNSVEIVEGNVNNLISLQKGEHIGEYRVTLVPKKGIAFPLYGFNITLQATDKGVPGLSANESFYVNILDTKTMPKFTKPVYDITVEEIAPINTPLMFVSITGTKVNHLDIRFEIVDNKNGLFKINQFSGLISTSSKLNTEKVSSVELKVIVYNKSQPKPLNPETTIIKINITDANDNAPKFAIPDNVSEIYIKENLPKGSTIFHISANDKDKNENGKISYSITNSKDIPFEIDPLTGALKTTDQLDYETMRHSYKLNIRVSDWGMPFSREAEMVFKINIQDVSDNVPYFEKVNCQGYLSRDAPINTEILIVPAIDFDINDVISYEIESGNSDSCFNLNRESARILLNCSLKDVSEKKRHLRITANDGNHISDPINIEMTLVNSKQNTHLANSLVNIKCQTTDIFQRLQNLVTSSRQNNIQTDYGITDQKLVLLNTAPLFNNTIPTQIEVSESLTVGSVIKKLEAIDNDSGYNGMLVYVIKSGDIDGHFKVDMYTGELMVMSPLDREIRDEFNLFVEVIDLGSPSLSANISINIKVLDENDNPPKFEQEQYSATISENIVINATVTQVSATDKDLGDNAVITYIIVSDSDHFVINPTTGIISVNKALDRERHPVYTVLVRASDKGSKHISLSSTATVLVELTDINDVVPEFTPETYSVRIREDIPLGAIATVVTAADTDEGVNGEVTYSLVFGEDYFEIDSETGVIRIIQHLDYEIHQVHNISVRAQDGGVPPLVSVCFINLEVVDVNENLKAPEFDNFFAHGYVSENEPVGTTVMFVTARDPDSTDDGITYSIRDGTGLGRFSIDNNGTITTSQVLDRETATHYWLTVYAQDDGLVPLYSKLEVYIEVKDTNDHIPMTFDPVYYGSVPENSLEAGTFVTQVQAFDLDRNLGQELSYTITRFDPDNFFTIESDTGIIRTTGKPLDREKEAVHQLEVTVSDNGDPALTYQTRVYVTVEDENDNKPQFTERLYRLWFPQTSYGGLDIPVFQALAWDEDTGTNGKLTFDIRDGKDDSQIFSINTETGMVYATSDLVSGDVHHFVIRATDGGQPRPRKATAKVRVEVVERLKRSRNAPQFTLGKIEKRVFEDDKVGSMVELLAAYDNDGDTLFYSIIDGDPEHQFYIGLGAGNLVVARPLDYETTRTYNLTIQVTDGTNFDNCTVYIHVVDTNDNNPLFTSLDYHGNFPESFPVGTTLLKVTATDADDDKLIYVLPHCCNSASTLQLFTVNAETGDIVVKSALDREVSVQHNLTVMVSDQGVSANKNFTRVTINILDHNDHQPVFLSQQFHGRVFETAAFGTSVVQVMAVDQDRGQNAEITFSILTGNIGGVFALDRLLGIVTVAKELDRDTKEDYSLVVMATDKGDNPMSNTATVLIDVTISDNAPPKFDLTEYMAELHENEPEYTNVYTVTANCRSSIIYTIEGGNDKRIFAINPNSGVVYTKKSVDYEEGNFFNLTIKATSIIHSSAMTYLCIHIIDENDNAPEFIQDLYIGNITESAKPGTVVLNATNEPLVVLATDKDFNLNALLQYEIRDEYAKDFVAIDHNTGAVRTVVEFDHEVMDKLEFSVEVWDMGKPQQRSKSPAKVVLYVNDVNDTPPKFELPNYAVEVLLPTYKDVVVLKLKATDADTGVNSKLVYSITSGNDDKKFNINTDTGAIFVVNGTDLKDDLKLTAEVTDGVFRTETIIDITVVQADDTKIRFTKENYQASVRENYDGIEILSVIQIAGKLLNEQYSFHLLNGQDKFEIGYTSGVLTTTGVTFDREEISLYNLVVEVRHETTTDLEKAHAVVMVTIEDENDNSPMFVNQPYHAVIVYDAQPGQVIKQVKALDGDTGLYGQVTYNIRGRGDLDNKFGIQADSGKITVARPLTESDVGKEIKLLVLASDSDTASPKTSQTTVKLTIISSKYPVFDQQVYKASIPEYYPAGSSVSSVMATSPTNQKLIYTIVNGDRYEDFDVNFNIAMAVHGQCLVTVRGVLDYDVMKAYNLTLKATETMSGLTATTVLLVDITDVNNGVPSFTSETYTTNISEAVAIGASVTMVTATDTEPGNNGLLHYTLLPVNTGSRDIDCFYIDSQTGVLTTRKFLDREKQSKYELMVEATDAGVPSLSSKARVIIHVTDLNDNPPLFDQPSYQCTITDKVSRGQLVTKVSATDPDVSSSNLLRYSIIGGNDRQSFVMDEEKGIISLSEQRKPDLHSTYFLNISVSDGVFTNFASVTIRVQNSNNYAPRFKQDIYIAEFPENYGEGMLVTQVSATDGDVGTYGMLTYTIPSMEMQKYFRVDAYSGEIFSVQVLDRESQSVYSIPVAATDNGGRMDYTRVHISITDQNDNVPQFLAQKYKKTLLTLIPLNTTLMTIQAEDNDSGVNGDILYSFSPGTISRVTQMLHIQPETGVITLLKELTNSANELFSFFVTASDQGTTPMKNDVPVEMWVTDNVDAQPKFTQDTYSFFMLESDPISTVIATVKADSSVPLEYIIVPGFTKSSNSPTKFGIDDSGHIHVAGELDMETTCAYMLTVQAQTLTATPLVQQTTVSIRLMDVNDNYPYFESNPYRVTVLENSDTGVDVVQVVAHDNDKSSKLTYSFAEEMVKYSHIFTIDSHTGVITLSSPLDRETQELYNLTVWVRDSDSIDALRNFTIVQVVVMDSNDNPPTFTKTSYRFTVHEDAYEGTILRTLTTVDKDVGVNTETRYYITEGDPQGKFKIRKNGDLFVNRPLDRELVPRYKLTAAATDGGFVTMTSITIDILDANDNAPVCLQSTYRPLVSEDVSTTWIIARVKATDDDEYGSLRYTLSGEGAKYFYLEPRSGVLTAGRALDRERTDFYHLVAKATDEGQKSCKMDIYITVSDVNDNRPTFTPVTGSIMLSEDATVNTLVYRVAATDDDLGINRHIVYSLVDDADGTFKMDAKSGLLQLAKKLDRETTPSYKITVVAKDKGTPQLTSSLDLDIVVLDVNDNPPEFGQTTYLASISESAAIGQSVTRIQATSRDTGINAKISYYIQAGNDKNKFTIDSKTGQIRTAGLLDHEKVPGYVLTVRAQDHGETPLSNTAYVEINVTDINDNPPTFLQKVYTAKIREDAKVGSKVIQVLSSDPDSAPMNKAVNYSIETGDHLHMFDIQQSDGSIVVHTQLDREAVSSYSLTVRATNYHLYSDTVVTIDVLDFNDCPPRFTEDNYTVFVQEDKEVTSCVLKFKVTDDDLDPNGPPFTFDIIHGDEERRFRMDPDGNLCIAGNLNRKVTANYDLVVRVFDQGTPAMYSDVDVAVSVIEESTYSPEVTNIAVSISSYLDSFPGGVIGSLKAVDADKYDTLTYTVVSPNRNLFDIDKKDGRIIAFAGLDSGNYVVNISVTDGKYTTYGTVDIEVNSVTEDMIKNSVTIQFAGIRAEDFVKNYKRDFQRVLKRELGVKPRDVDIINIQKSQDTTPVANRAKRETTADNNLDVLFAVKKGQDYIQQGKLKRKVTRSMSEFETTMNVKVLKVFSDICRDDMCEGGECVGYVEFDKDSLVPVTMDGGSFVAAKHRYTYECVCPNGFVGDNCLQNPTSCTQNPCPIYKVCSPDPTHGYVCSCPLGKTGRHCEKDLENRCDDTTCQRGDTPITFSGNSYARWTLSDPIMTRLSLSMRIKTRKDTANLMFAKGLVDYSILELVNGQVQYRFDCGSGEGLVMIQYHIADGKWHTIMVERRGNQAEIFLDGQYSAIAVAPGNNNELNLDNADVYFGAEVETYQNGYVDVRKGFRGCVEDIRIFNVRLPISGSNAVALSQDFKQVEFSCKDSDPFIGNNVCSSFPCMNGGQCEVTGPTHYICKCPDKYRGAFCEIDTDPCQRQPCLNNGVCENIEGIPNEFNCKCPDARQGRRCEYGRFCLPNPCLHGGTCVEGPSSKMCMCRAGYYGKSCESVLNACDSNPCQNNAQCIQDGTMYVCNCSDTQKGQHCEDIVLPSITSSAGGINAEEIYAIAGIAGGLILVVIIFVVVRMCRQRNKRQQRNNITAGVPNDGTEVYLNLLKDDKNTYKAENMLKIENNKKKTPPSPMPSTIPIDRPASYTPSGHDSINTLNNFDTLRNYGSAADELETMHNIPPYNMDFLTFVPPRTVASIQPICPPPPQSDSDSKENWEFACQNILQNYIADKNSDKSKLMPIGTVVPMSRPTSRIQGQDTTSFSSLPISEVDDDLPANKKKGKKGYHWDTSDWAPEKSLPNISEVPVCECPDSPGSQSPHSNESNTHINNVDPAGYYNTDGEYIDCEYVGDSENDIEDSSSDVPNYEEILAEQSRLLEDYDMPSNNMNLHVHPNYYLPLNNSFTSEQNGDENWPVPPPYNGDVSRSDSSPTSSEDDNDSVLHYGFPVTQNNINRLSMITTDSDVNVDPNRLSGAFTTDSEFNGEYNRVSLVDDEMSDISGLCEIEDSEVNLSESETNLSEDENTPLPLQRTHTEV